jgi:peptidoglycan L-alanyl-D-glutamate endopeptidase CwlK
MRPEAMRCKRLDMLKDPFAGRVMLLVELCATESIHVAPFETHRSLQRQMQLYAKGRAETTPGDWVIVNRSKIVTRAKPGESAHNWDMAADFVLDVDRVPVRMREWRGKMHADAWDDETPEAVDTWEKFGQAARSCGLNWGGDFKSIRDLPHVEMPGWQSHRRADWKLEVRRVIGPIV